MKAALQVKPIILHHQPVVSLDTGGISGEPLVVAAPLPTTIDVERLLGATGLTVAEQEYLLASEVDGRRGGELARDLGISTHEADLARRRVRDKIRRFAAGHSAADFVVIEYGSVG